MNKKNQNTLVTILIILIIAVIAVLVLTKKPAETDEEIVKCISSKATLYIQLGCPHCKDQEEMFGENVKYLNIVDCWYESKPCIENNITHIPAWIIKNEKYEGVQSIDKLKELTGC